ncbi:uncharacterized protein (TIGR03083 family) [Isoptericola jiangsuensis]|uniref:Uncharacterized protein (TIGR03083 family) n=1 Tax=Isoptericola jiangsuensis TaxID=548579 RepID=A0A2A9EYK5_9MICO|nr:maleylpyruvate isomerase N-terminal domain-containing protein [Isoptericola jiangsuensis]PFG43646.1 uncharacterized protein (TIGR03083 family) [Isoptericola jiangsuensis]
MTTRPAVDPATGLRTDGGPDLDHLALLTALQAAFAAGTAGADPAGRVPACGRWKVRHLVEHLGRIHHWAAGQARRAQETPLGRGPFDLVPFYAAQAAELRTTLTDLGPTADSWTLLGRGPATFWRRRQTHETLVHLHDLRAAALGSGTAVAAEDPIDVDADVWADGVDEIVTMFQPRQVRLERMAPLERTVALHATDLGRTWVLGAPADAAGDAAAATVHAPARELDLLLWRRLTPAEAGAEVTGDPLALEAALGAAIVP